MRPTGMLKVAELKDAEEATQVESMRKTLATYFQLRYKRKLSTERLKISQSLPGQCKDR